jgi:hypothetical protein
MHQSSQELVFALAVMSTAARALLFKITVLEKRRPSALAVLDDIAAQLLREPVTRPRPAPRARAPMKAEG